MITGDQVGAVIFDEQYMTELDVELIQTAGVSKIELQENPSPLEEIVAMTPNGEQAGQNDECVIVANQIDGEQLILCLNNVPLRGVYEDGVGSGIRIFNNVSAQSFTDDTEIDTQDLPSDSPLATLKKVNVYLADVQSGIKFVVNKQPSELVTFTCRQSSGAAVPQTGYTGNVYINPVE